MGLATINPDPIPVQRKAIHRQDDTITVVLRTYRLVADCPVCHCYTERVHSWYQRTLPWHGCAVQLDLQTRHGRYQNPTCPATSSPGGARACRAISPTDEPRWSRRSPRWPASLVINCSMMGSNELSDLGVTRCTALPPDCEGIGPQFSSGGPNRGAMDRQKSRCTA